MKKVSVVLKIWLTAVLTAFLTLTVNVRAENASLRQKARYYFTQGSLEAASDNMANAYEYFKKAYELDPDYSDAAFTYGGQRLFVRTDTLQTEKELMRSLKMMQEYVDLNPKDVYATQIYGYMTTALDTVEESVRVYENTYQLLPKETQLLPFLADAYIRIMKGKEAIGSLERYEKIEGKSHDVSLKKITIFLSMQDTTGAISEVESLITENPRDPYSLILKGNLYEITGNMDSVVKAYKDAEAIAPANGAVKMSLANYYRATGDSVMLDNMMYEALLSEDFQLEEKIGILGDYLQKLIDEEGDKNRGDHLFSVLQSQYPHEPGVLEMSARYDAAKGDYQGAAEAINYALDMDPANEQYWMMLLSFDLMDSNYRGTVQDYGRMKDHVTPSSRAKNLYASAASMLEDTSEAESIIDSLLKETDPRLTLESRREDLSEVRKNLDYDGLVWVSSLYCMLGDLHYKGGESEKGFNEYETSLYFLADNALTLNNFAYFLSEEDRELEKAKKMSRRSLDLADNNPTYLDTYAWVLYKLGEYREAYEYMKLAMELAEEQGEVNEEYETHMEAIKLKMDSEK